MKPIYEYMDYRNTCAFCLRRKSSNIHSIRIGFFSKAGFKSPNFLKLVIDGNRNLTKESVFKVIKAFNLNKRS